MRRADTQSAEKRTLEVIHTNLDLGFDNIEAKLLASGNDTTDNTQRCREGRKKAAKWVEPISSDATLLLSAANCKIMPEITEGGAVELKAAVASDHLESSLDELYPLNELKLQKNLERYRRYRPYADRRGCRTGQVGC